MKLWNLLHGVPLTGGAFYRRYGNFFLILRHPNPGARGPVCGSARGQDRWGAVYPGGAGKRGRRRVVRGCAGGGGPLAGDTRRPAGPGPGPPPTGLDIRPRSSPWWASPAPTARPPPPVSSRTCWSGCWGPRRASSAPSKTRSAPFAFPPTAPPRRATRFSSCCGRWRTRGAPMW